jgi:hypothetical protein
MLFGCGGLDEVVRTGARLHVLTLDRLRSFDLL